MAVYIIWRGNGRKKKQTNKQPKQVKHIRNNDKTITSMCKYMTLTNHTICEHPEPNSHDAYRSKTENNKCTKI